ncbi:DsbA family protein [uncultured Alsobacter sp.]|uniref:DsbA family protein n=1 Tax=uncultured Alsobacter sp. TaxID=1748258 RepID=UPI0025EF062C|nr:DsbA family protein [uncultured Alsobacter sp.]
MPLSRRTLLAAGLAGGCIRPAWAEGWFELKDDDGAPVENMRTAVELVAPIDELPGRMMLGTDSPFVRIIEFFDYNCPACRRAAPDMEALVRQDDEVGVVLVHNPILATSSRVAAAFSIAIATRHGQDMALRFHAEMFRRPGPVTAGKLRTVTSEIGLDPQIVGREAEALATAVKAHEDAAAALGFGVTPSFVLGSVSLLGYPGAKAMRRFTQSAAQCGEPLCR